MKQVIDIIINMLYHGLEYYGKFYSNYRGIVADRNDPEHQGRLRLQVPGIIPQATDYWAPSKGTYAGRNYGTHIIPEVGDVVWVSFENGDPNKPVWEQGYFGAGDINTERYQDVDNFWFFTPTGHKVEFNDTENEIIITHKDGNIVAIKEQKVSIKSKEIYLGDVDQADEPAVLGDTLQKLLEAIIKNIANHEKATSDLGKGLSDAIDKLTLGVAPQPAIAQLLITMKAYGLVAASHSTRHSSQTRQLIENLNQIARKLPRMKSETVRLNK